MEIILCLGGVFCIYQTAAIMTRNKCLLLPVTKNYKVDVATDKARENI